MSVRDDLSEVIAQAIEQGAADAVHYLPDAVLAWVRGLDPDRLAEVIGGRVEKDWGAVRVLTYWKSQS